MAAEIYQRCGADDRMHTSATLAEAFAHGIANDHARSNALVDVARFAIAIGRPDHAEALSRAIPDPGRSHVCWSSLRTRHHRTGPHASSLRRCAQGHGRRMSTYCRTSTRPSSRRSPMNSLRPPHPGTGPPGANERRLHRRQASSNLELPARAASAVRYLIKCALLGTRVSRVVLDSRHSALRIPLGGRARSAA